MTDYGLRTYNTSGGVEVDISTHLTRVVATFSATFNQEVEGQEVMPPPPPGEPLRPCFAISYIDEDTPNPPPFCWVRVMSDFSQRVYWNVDAGATFVNQPKGGTVVVMSYG